MALTTELTARLGCRYPIIQNPMTYVSNVGLVGAVSAAGGCGIYASTIAPAGGVEEQVRKIRARTDAPFGVYVTGLQPNVEEVVDAVIANEVRAVSYGYGLDAKIIERLKAAGVACITTVGAARHAVKAVALGADIVVAQGGEAGGHTGPVATTVLLPQVLDSVDVPVVAAGGFFDGRGLAAALAFGASGIAMGTRFMMTTDSPVSADALEYYRALSDPAAIRVSSAIDGKPQRVIENRLVLEMEARSRLQHTMAGIGGARQVRRSGGFGWLDFIKSGLRALRARDGGVESALRTAQLPQLLKLGLEQGRIEDGLLPSGQAAAAISELVSCETLISEMVTTAEQRLGTCGRALEKTAIFTDSKERT